MLIWIFKFGGALLSPIPIFCFCRMSSKAFRKVQNLICFQWLELAFSGTAHMHGGEWAAYLFGGPQRVL